MATILDDGNRYALALQRVNQTLITADSYVIPGQHAGVQVFRDANDNIAAGFSQGMSLNDAALVKSAADLEEMLDSRSRTYLLNPDGTAKNLGLKAASDAQAAIGQDLLDAAAKLGGALALLPWILGGVALLALVLTGLYAYGTFKR